MTREKFMQMLAEIISDFESQQEYSEQCTWERFSSWVRGRVL